MKNMADTILIILGATLTCASPLPEHEIKPLPPTPPISDIYPSGRRFVSGVAPTCTTRDDDVLTGRNGMIDESFRWTKFSVHPDMAYNDQERRAINDAVYILSQIIPCVKFGIWPPNSTPKGDYVRIIKGTNNGCNSYIGRLGNRQDMNLQVPGCMSIGTILHEMIHALGFQHEHNRSDRDDYVNILWKNVIPGKENSFKKYPADQVTAFGVPYNLQSIMHYDSHAFSKNKSPTMVAKSGLAIGSTGTLQDSDKKKLKAMYKC